MASKIPQAETSSFLPSLITYSFMVSNSIGTASKAYAHADYYTIAFVVFIFIDFLSLEYCLTSYHLLPRSEKSGSRMFLKYAIWFLYSAMMFGFTYQFAPLFPSAGYGISLYVVSTVGSAFIFYVYIIYDKGSSDNGCCKCCSGEKSVFGKVNDEEMKRLVSVCEEV